jgi:hypothetical protein
MERSVKPPTVLVTPFVRWNRTLAANHQTLTDRAEVSNEFRTHSVLGVPDLRIAADISRYSPGETRVEMNCPRASPLGSFGRPAFLVINYLINVTQIY